MKGSDMRVLRKSQDKQAIRSVLDPVPGVSGATGAIRAPLAGSAGNDACLYSEDGGADRGEGNEGSADGFPFAFYCHRTCQYTYERFSPSEDDGDGSIAARAYAAANGLVFDGQMSEHGLAVAMSV